MSNKTSVPKCHNFTPGSKDPSQSTVGSDIAEKNVAAVKLTKTKTDISFTRGDFGIKYQCVSRILHEYLSLNKKSYRWVLQHLSDKK